MPACPARHDLYLLKFTKIGLGDADFIQKNAATFESDTAEHRVLNGSGLLKDLFEHEVLIAALFPPARGPQNVGDLTRNRLAVEVCQVDAIGRQHRYVAIVQKEHVARVAQNRRHIRGYEELVVTQADYHGRPLTRRYNLVGIAAGDHA